MNKSFNGWVNVDKINLENVIDLVLTNGKIETIKSDDWVLTYVGDENYDLSILDFGCGIGRNIFDFAQKMSNWNFIGYDNQNMLNKAKEYLSVKYDKNLDKFSNLSLIDSWDLVKTKKFDCIYATLVFQHIHENDLNVYLKDIKNMTSKLIVSGRRFNDDMIDGEYKNTWEILEKNGYYPSNAEKINYNKDGDPHDHITCIYEF